MLVVPAPSRPRSCDVSKACTVSLVPGISPRSPPADIGQIIPEPCTDPIPPTPRRREPRDRQSYETFRGYYLGLAPVAVTAGSRARRSSHPRGFLNSSQHCPQVKVSATMRVKSVDVMYFSHGIIQYYQLYRNANRIQGLGTAKELSPRPPPTRNRVNIQIPC